MAWAPREGGKGTFGSPDNPLLSLVRSTIHKLRAETLKTPFDPPETRESNKLSSRKDIILGKWAGPEWDRRAPRETGDPACIEELSKFGMGRCCSHDPTMSHILTPLASPPYLR